MLNEDLYGVLQGSKGSLCILNWNKRNPTAGQGFLNLLLFSGIVSQHKWRSDGYTLQSALGMRDRLVCLMTRGGQQASIHPRTSAGSWDPRLSYDDTVIACIDKGLPHKSLQSILRSHAWSVGQRRFATRPRDRMYAFQYQGK